MNTTLSQPPAAPKTTTVGATTVAKPASSRAPDKFQNSLIKSGYFIGALLLHLVVFLMLATWVIFQAPAVHVDGTFLSTNLAPPPPPPPSPPSASGGDAANNFEPTAEAVPTPSVPSLVTTASISSFNVNSVKVSIPNLPAAASPPAGSGLAGHDAPGTKSGAGSPFGTTANSGTGDLEGYLYDFKQTPDGKETPGMDPGRYHEVIRQFVANNWDEGLLRSYYKASKPLHTTSIFVPIIDAKDGPAAFGVADEVKPNMYCVLYKVTAAPPQDGTYHFVGGGDDIMLVRLNHKTVLDGCDRPATDELRDKEQKVSMTNFNPTWPDNGIFKVGPSFHVSAHEACDIEVLIGEEPGGRSDFFLYIEREESTYEKQSNGTPLWPIFQLDNKPIQPQGEAKSWPPFSATPEPWAPASGGL